MEPEREERSARVVELPKERGGRCERREQLGLGFAIMTEFYFTIVTKSVSNFNKNKFLFLN